MECKENNTRRKRHRKASSPVYNHRPSPQPAPVQTFQTIRDAINSPDVPASDIGPPSPVSEAQTSTRVVTQDSPNSYPLYFHIYDHLHPPSSATENAELAYKPTPRPSASSCTQERVPVVDLVDMQLPPSEIASLLLDSYIHNTHWYQLVVHEPSFRLEFNEMIRCGSIPPHRFSFLILSMVVLAMGSTFANERAMNQICPGFDLKALQKKMIRKAESNFFEIFEIPTIESAQVGTLLTTYLGFHDNRPRRAYVVLGAALKAALSIGLHNESSWREIDSTQREIRKRCWRALCISETFVAVNCGRPSLINQTHWETKMLRNIDDTQIRCPGFDSTELFEDGSRQDVTILSYQMHMFNLYTVIFDIMEIFYRQKATPIQHIIDQAKSIRERLNTWKRNIPPELTLSSFKSERLEPEVNGIIEVFKVQALALELLYYNAQIILYRPFLTYRSARHLDINKPGTPINSSEIPGAVEGTVVKEIDLEFYRTCRSECWEAAMKTTKIRDYQDILRLAGRTLIAPFIGIHCFTAGAVLCLFALSSPLTATAQESKRALGKLVTMPQLLNSPTTLSKQSANIMKDLLQLILTEEMKGLTSGRLDHMDGPELSRESAESIAQSSQSLDKLVTSRPGESPYPTQSRRATNDGRLSSSITATEDVTNTSRTRNEAQVPPQHRPIMGTNTFDDAVTALQSGLYSRDLCSW
ncbi:fungal-specific transcription factor domain-containing protein [Fusarium oxysporum Fo47]|nr:fungal-specific transcription factor domain-containing protein [Fusarium oxysporum Fo47]WJG35640.1 fungal-specific transcription factor domain-domain-containing protein [Fusarium oxysporum Fo47]